MSGKSSPKYCVFCSIVNKEAPATIRYEDARIIVFNSIAHLAPVHLLFCPKEHMTQEELLRHDVLPHLYQELRRLATELKDGFRVVQNIGWDAHQTIEHAHVQLLAGRYLGINFAGSHPLFY